MASLPHGVPSNAGGKQPNLLLGLLRVGAVILTAYSLAFALMLVVSEPPESQQIDARDPNVYAVQSELVSDQCLAESTLAATELTVSEDCMVMPATFTPFNVS